MHACPRPCQTLRDGRHLPLGCTRPPVDAVTVCWRPRRPNREDRMRQHLTDPLRFFAAFVAHPRQMGAVLPTSRTAVRDMLDLADVPAADLVVELGAGTGVQTGEILAR